MQSIKQKHASCMLCIAFSAVLLLSACSGVGDWTYDDLPGNYEIWRINSNNISLCKPREDNQATANVMIGSYIDKITFNEQYIAVQQVNPAERAEAGKNSDNLEISYYLLDTDSEELLGPLDESTFGETCKELDITDFPAWVYTTDLPGK